MSKAGRPEVLGAVAVAALLVCCGGPLLLAALVALVLSTGLIVQGAVLAGAIGLALAGALTVRYVQRSAVAKGARDCAGCVDDPPSRHQHAQHSASPPP